MDMQEAKEDSTLTLKDVESFSEKDKNVARPLKEDKEDVKDKNAVETVMKEVKEEVKDKKPVGRPRKEVKEEVKDIKPIGRPRKEEKDKKKNKSRYSSYPLLRKFGRVVKRIFLEVIIRTITIMLVAIIFRLITDESFREKVL